MAPHFNNPPSEVSVKSLEGSPAKTYKSPQSKLVRFFEKSRNQWKSKYRDAKIGVKRLQNRVRFLEKGKDRDKRRIRELEAELRKMKLQVCTLEKEVSALKKNT